MIIATAPGRCGIAGDPSDRYGGSVLACSTRERGRCTLSPDTENFCIAVGEACQIIADSSDLALIPGDPLNTARAVLSALEVFPGQAPPLHLTASTDLPLCAGLAAHTALLAAMTGCILAHLELRLNPYEIAELIRKIEHDLLGWDCGYQDHYMVVFGGLNFLNFYDKNERDPREPTLPFGTVEPLEKYVSDLPLLLAYQEDTRRRKPGSHTPVSGERCSRLEGLARTAKRALLARDWDELSQVMNRNYAEQRELGLSSEISEKLIAAALDGGAESAKLAEDSSAGTIVALTHTPERTSEALRKAGAEVILSPLPSPGLTVSVEVTL